MKNLTTIKSLKLIKPNVEFVPTKGRGERGKKLDAYIPIFFVPNTVGERRGSRGVGPMSLPL